MHENGKIRMGSSLVFDPVKEKDILDMIETLNKRHSLGKFVSHLLRLAFESPEVYGNGDEVKQLVSKMSSMGVTPTRQEYFNQLSKEVATLKKRVDEIYDMSYKVYTLAQMGKTLGIEKKADNSLMASFVLERQISEMCLALGIDDFSAPYLSGRMEEVHARADKTLEYIIEAYDSIVQELRHTVKEQSEKIVYIPTASTFVPDGYMNGVNSGQAVTYPSAIHGNMVQIGNGANMSGNPNGNAGGNASGNPNGNPNGNTGKNSGGNSGNEGEDYIIDLVERPADQDKIFKKEQKPEEPNIVVKKPTGNRAALMKQMMAGKR